MDFCHLQIISNCLLFTYIWCICTYWTAFYVRKWKSASWSVFNCQNNIVHFYQYHIWNCLLIIHRTMVFLCITVKLVWELVKEKLVVQFLFLYLCITDFHLYPQNTGFSLYNCKTRLRTCLREVSCPVAHFYINVTWESVFGLCTEHWFFFVYLVCELVQEKLVVQLPVSEADFFLCCCLADNNWK